MCLNFVEERTQKCDRENREWRWCQIKYLQVAPWQLSNSAIMPLSEIKSYVVVMSFYIKMMKRRTLQACSLRHSIKKGMLSVQGKLDLFKSGRGGESSHPHSPPLATRLLLYAFFTTRSFNLEKPLIQSVCYWYSLVQ